MAGNFYLGWVLYNIICIGLLIIQYNHIKKNQYTWFIALLSLSFLILALFGNSISPDYWPYRNLVDLIARTQHPTTHIEYIYIWLIHHIGNNFNLYQLIIYIPQFLIFYLISISLPNKRIILYSYCFAIIGLYPSIVGRFFLFNVVLILGVICIGNNHRIIGITLILISSFLHKLGIFLAPITLLILIFPFRGKNRDLYLISFLFIVLSITVRYIIHNYFNDLFKTLDGVQGSNYLAKEKGYNEGGSFVWQVIYVYQLLTTILLSFYVLYKLHTFFHTFHLCDKLIYKMLLGLTTIATFYFSLGLPDITIGSRIITVSIIPLSYIISILPEYVKISKYHKYIFLSWGIFYLMFNNAYIIGVSHINFR